MQGTDPSAAAAPSSSLLTAESQSELKRKPTWAQISFDDGFDLNIAGTSALGASSEKTDPSSSSMQATKAAYPDNANPAHPDTQENKRFSVSSASSNKALPSVPPASSTTPINIANTDAADRRQPSSESQASATLRPGSFGVASTAHGRVPSSQDGTPTPRSPITPQALTFASQMTAAATPQQQPQRLESESTPLAKQAVHQPSRSHSGSGLAADQQTQPSPSRPISSADAYMLPSESSSRPGTAMSHLSGSNWMHDGPSNRSSVGTTSSTPVNQAKRASVLSFQTANSAGFTSGDEADEETYEREELADNTFHASPAAPGMVNHAPLPSNNMRPWIDRGQSGYGSSNDERHVPGGLPGAFWDAQSAQSSPRPAIPRPHAREELRSAPAVAPTQTDAGIPRASAQNGPADGRASDDNAKNDSSRDLRESAALLPESTLAPIKTQGLAPSPANLPLSSTTITAPSDETAQVMLRSPDFNRDRQLPSVAPKDAAPLPPAKDVRAVEHVAPKVSFVSTPDAANRRLNAAATPAPVDNVIPPPLPTEAVQAQPAFDPGMLRNGPTLVSDYRKKPLADISPAQKAAGLAHLQAQAKGPQQQSRTEMQSHVPPTNPPAEAPPIPVLERGRRKSNASLTANVALAQQAAAVAPGAQSGDAMDRPGTASTESVSHESSAPPDGEVEARAEWERRRRMKRKDGKKQNDVTKAQKGRSDAFKTQLKPLQLVPADNLTGFNDRNGAPNTAARGNDDRTSMVKDDRNVNVLSSAPADANSAKQTYSTQQLQKLQAREQRRSVGAFSAAMAAANVVSSGSNGPYPVFASPGSGPQKPGSRQYPGLMAQRSLVPPFELQHRPDGLPSGMIGPDGVRRSLNDPEVCLECMMRDEDMIDITVVGHGIWERESDRDFEEAVRLEAEEAANGSGVYSPAEGDGQGDSRSTRGSRRPRKKIGKGEPLTVERLKLHTQMNPPASSFRWRTLQTFLAVQAKYIAMEQSRMRLEAEKKARSIADSTGNRGSIVLPDATGQQPERSLSSPFAPPRDGSAAVGSVSRQSMLPTTADDGVLTPQQSQEKERDIAAAQAARRKMTAGTATTESALGAAAAYPVTPLQTRTLPQTVPGRSNSDPDDQLAAPASVGSGLITSNGGRRMPFASAQAARAASVQDLRSAADASRSSPIGYPLSPGDSLVPPSRSVLGTSPTGTPSRVGRSGASQLSLMHSGSMIDMHVAQEDRVEHRINQTGFLPGTPLGVESPSAINRSFYGFPGDGDSSLPEAAAFERSRSRMVSGDGYVDPMEAGPRGLEVDQDETSQQRKKKGLRGLFSKLAGSSGAPSRQSSSGAGAGGSINGSIASRNASKRSQGSGNDSPRARKTSISADQSLDTTGLPQNGMLSKARKSTSSFFRNGVEPADESNSRPILSGNNSIFQNPSGMGSQNSIDLGPFQSASPRMDAFASTNGRVMPQQDAARMRKASNPMIQKYLNSPSPQTQATTGASPAPTSLPPTSGGVPGGRMTSYASMRDLRTSTLPPIVDGEQYAEESDAYKSYRSGGGSAGVRKELPSMPLSAGVAEHRRTGSTGAGASRNSMVEPTSMAAPALVVARPAGSGLGEYAARPSMQASRNGRNADGFGAMADDASMEGNGPLRPPKNPRRPDSVFNSPSLADFHDGSDGLASGRRAFPQQGRSQSDAYPGSVGSAEKSKKSIFRLPFGRKKRESTIDGDRSRPSIVLSQNDAPAQGRPSMSLGRSFLPKLRERKSYGGLGAARTSFQTERQRVLSSPANETSNSDLPPRSQSAFGMARQRFMSMDLPRRSMNVDRSASRNRLSTVQYGYEDERDEDEDEDDGMEREPGYEAEFNRYAQEAAEERYLGTGSRGGGREVSFGRKSLNMLRESFRTPLRNVSGGERAK
ncbi:hypothetical protein PSEUBRA_004815 [Kalmanozyma brasiliensis GHG001]|uniref:Uncharacterized protein n=1 Tax=Kalmanozyma brasiliensis (strain GHG001) TaxID=1365824 RepID=V5EUI6_KALBG|nr:uncharacterized protein PSEUBRA_004815 [Kalmanozyma brasiliensis GHG001]EST05789.1 hypothetical protein PSEUBRA_004815 [Kalmanozyma brasiliensis GHG001]